MLIFQHNYIAFVKATDNLSFEAGAIVGMNLGLIGGELLWSLFTYYTL